MMLLLGAPGVGASESSWPVFLAARQRVLRGEGLVLSQTWSGRLDAGALYQAVIWRRAVDDGVPCNGMVPCGAHLELYELRDRANGTAELVLRASLNGNGWLIFEPSNGSDLTGDGIAELVLRDSTGGNCWACAPLRIFQVIGHQLREVQIRGPDYLHPQHLADLDGDGYPELLAIDTRWEFYHGFCHACSPGVWGVFVWRDGRYEEASREFPRFYEEKIAELEASLARSDRADDDIYLSDAVSVFLNYVAVGQSRQGLSRFRQLISPRPFRQAPWIAAAREIERDLQERVGL